MRLFYSPTSPFAAKVRMAARHCDIDLDCVSVDTVSEPAELLTANPLGKVPTLLLNDGTPVYDSRVICEYFDRISGNLLIPQGDAEWLRARKVEATSDGGVDGAILVVYEKRFRPEEIHHKPWTDRQWGKAIRALDALESEVGRFPETLDIGHFAVAGFLGWLSLRFAGQWEVEHPKLAAWIKAFPERYPRFADLMPKV
nr:glutathione S-transferase [Mangrovicella endophytica]